jgi:hypothetical protein
MQVILIAMDLLKNVRLLDYYGIELGSFAPPQYLHTVGGYHLSFFGKGYL